MYNVYKNVYLLCPQIGLFHFGEFNPEEPALVSSNPQVLQVV